MGLQVIERGIKLGGRGRESGDGSPPAVSRGSR